MAAVCFVASTKLMKTISFLNEGKKESRFGHENVDVMVMMIIFVD